MTLTVTEADRGRGRLARPGGHPGGARSWTLLAESNGEPVGPSELARRLGLPKSSIANICGALADAGLVRRIGTGFALGRRSPSSVARTWLASTRSRSSTRRRASLPDRLGGDGPVRRARRPRGHLPRAPRWTTARPAELADRSPAAGDLDRDRARPPWPHSPTTTSSAGLAGVTTLPRADAARPTRRSTS